MTKASAESVLGDVRRHHLMRVNDVLRRPSMYGTSEIAERLLLEAMAAVDSRLPQWQSEYEALQPRGAFAPTGVVGAYRTVLPVNVLRDATASIYAEIAHRLGWLELDRALSEKEFRHLEAGVGRWARQDRTLTHVLDTFGSPSVLIGGDNPRYPKTLAYTTASNHHDLICFHLWNSWPETSTANKPREVPSDPVLLAVRHRTGRFDEAFTFTPEGLRRRTCGRGGSSAAPSNDG